MAIGMEDVSEEELEESLELRTEAWCRGSNVFGEKHMSAIHQIRQHYRR